MCLLIDEFTFSSKIVFLCGVYILMAINCAKLISCSSAKLTVLARVPDHCRWRWRFTGWTRRWSQPVLGLLGASCSDGSSFGCQADCGPTFVLVLLESRWGWENVLRFEVDRLGVGHLVPREHWRAPRHVLGAAEEVPLWSHLASTLQMRMMMMMMMMMMFFIRFLFYQMHWWWWWWWCWISYLSNFICIFSISGLFYKYINDDEDALTIRRLSEKKYHENEHVRSETRNAKRDKRKEKWMTADIY